MLATLAFPVLAALGLSACSTAVEFQTVGVHEQADTQITIGPKKSKKGYPVNKPITVAVDGGRISDIRVTGPQGDLTGTLNSTGTHWTSDLSQLELGSTYKVEAEAVDRTGATNQLTKTLKTEAAKGKIRGRISPDNGDVVGVGMPVTVSFTQSIDSKRDQREIEQRLEITTEPEVEGSWSWRAPDKVQWRPKKYWPAHTKVTVNASLEGLTLAGKFAGEARDPETFSIGDSYITTVNLDNQRMTVRKNGKIIRKMGVSNGKKGYETRSGTKVIMSKEKKRIMDAATYGVSPSASDYYRTTVTYAMRLTDTGEFTHVSKADPDAIGKRDASHGCTRMTPEDGKWFYDQSRVGDVVDYVGKSPVTMEDWNGISVWNVPYDEWKKGSALAD